MPQVFEQSLFLFHLFLEKAVSCLADFYWELAPDKSVWVATASSVYQNFLPEMAVDGIRDGVQDGYSLVCNTWAAYNQVVPIVRR